MKINHELEPIYDDESKVLILGTMPSIKSREVGFYYGHPRNRFWITLEKVYNEKIGSNIEEKKQFLLKHHIALFDVLKSCEITSSKDSSIKKTKVNDLNKIIKNSKVQIIFTTGRKAFDLYNKYCFAKTKIKAIYLPSTSPANCPKNIDNMLYDSYKQIKDFTD